MQHWALQRDDRAADAWLVKVVAFVPFYKMIVLDETAKDGRDLKGSFGWGARGGPVVERDIPFLRDQRVSLLCALTPFGFADWRWTRGTFNSELFMQAIDEMLLQPSPNGAPPLIQTFPHVIIDNASYHTQAFDDAIAAAGGKVWRMPPYTASRLSPLDNGGFGLLSRCLHVHAGWLSLEPLPKALDWALRHCMPRNPDGSNPSARYCFHNCGFLENVA